MLRDGLTKVTGVIDRHERMMQKMGEQLVQLTLERDRAVLELEQSRVEDEKLRARLAKYGHAIKAYDNQHIPRPERS